MAAALFARSLSLAAQAPNPAPPSPPTSALEREADPAVRPGDDFFAYANGAWLRRTTIPKGRSRWTVRNEIEIRTADQMNRLFAAADSAAPGTLGRKVADFRMAYADTRTIESRGLSPLGALLDSVSALKDKRDLARFIGHDVGVDVDPLNYVIVQSSHLLGLSVEQSIHGEPDNVAFLVQGGLGLSDREEYLSADTAARRHRQAYRQYIGKMLAQAGFDHADRRADAVLELETRLARTQMAAEPSSSDTNSAHRWTQADLARRAPGLDWSVLLGAAGLAREGAIVAWQPGAITGLAAQVGATPLAVWQDYFRFHLLHRYADVLPASFDGAANEMRASIGAPTVDSRTQRALDTTRLTMADAIGVLYAERYFSAGQKKRIQEVVANVTTEFEHRVERVTWLSAGAKAMSLAKLRRLYVGVGYPERQPDFADLTIDPKDAFGNVRRIDDRNRKLVLSHLGQPVDWIAWSITPQTVGALLVFQQNVYDFAAALLQPPKFDSIASQAAVYGSIGAIIGHDVTHYVDPLGSEFDTTGAKRTWWTAEDAQGYATMAAPLVRQFSSYQPFTDLAVNGSKTRGENVADLGGLQAAFDAWRATDEARHADQSALRRGDREFFLAWGETYRGKITDPDLRNRILNDDHAPEAYRIDTVRNLDAWYAAFDIQPSDRLYLEPAARVKVW